MDHSMIKKWQGVKLKNNSKQTVKKIKKKDEKKHHIKKKKQNKWIWTNFLNLI
jgi:hypothetical protein